MWLLETTTLNQMMQFARLNLPVAKADQEIFAASALSRASEGPRLLTTAGSVAEIHIDGVLTNRPDFFAWYFGGGNVTYPEIRAAVSAAAQDNSVDEIILKVGSSPGGQIDGLFETLDLLRNLEKPLKAVVSNAALSATYALISQADKITAVNAAARFGSVGVVVDIPIDDDLVSITSEKAPKKRPDVSTEAGKKVVVQHLNDLHTILVEAIANGRRVTPEKVNTDFGQGGVFLAKEAQRQNMIDDIQEISNVRPITSAQSNNNGGETMEGKDLTLDTLQAKYPEVYQAALKAGVQMERDRVTAHLTLGEAAGDLAIAVTAIKDGASMTETMRAQYSAAGMNRQNLNARSEDDAAAADALKGLGTGVEAENDGSEQVVGMVETLLKNT